jgi:hypothetical protein
MGLEHDSVSNIFKIHGLKIADLHLSEKSDPYIYRILLPIYERGKKFIPGMMLILTEDDVTNIRADVNDREFNSIFAGVGIIHYPLTKLFAVYNDPFTSHDQTFTREKTNPITYNTLLKIYNSGRTLIKNPYTASLAEKEEKEKKKESSYYGMSKIFQGTKPRVTERRRVNEDEFGEESNRR